MQEEIINKLGKMVAYFCSKEKKGLHGRTKLAKLLWFADTTFYNQAGKSMSGLENYQKYPKGPFTTALYEVEKKLQDNKVISVKEKTYSNNTGKVYHSINEEYIKKNPFNAKEKKILDEVSARLLTYNSKDVSDISHEEWWSYFKEKENIPISIRSIKKSEKLSDEKLSDEELNSFFNKE